MKPCSWIKRVEAFADGESTAAGAVEAHLSECPGCRAHRERLLQWRAALRPEAPALSDQQFPVFMDGIRSGISQSPPRYRGFWALSSLAAAALVIAVAMFSIFDGAVPVPAEAGPVESVSTDIDGATVEWGNSGGGVTTIWISKSEDDF